MLKRTAISAIENRLRNGTQRVRKRKAVGYVDQDRDRHIETFAKRKDADVALSAGQSRPIDSLATADTDQFKA